MSTMKDPGGDTDFDDIGGSAGNVAFEMDYALALDRSAKSFTKLQSDLLAALVAAPGNELSGSQAARLLGRTHHGGLNTVIVGLAKKLTRAIGVEPPKRADGTERWWHVVATARPGKKKGNWIWILRPALRDAAVAAGIGTTDLGSFPEERDEAPLFEGGRKTVLVNAYERDPVARRHCIAHHGTACSVCGNTLAEIYGPIAEGVIHVHHLKPLAECGGEEYELDPIADLRPVCPNCHVILHLRQPPYGVEELRAILAERRNVAIAQGCP